jgi:hypothetical protein
MMCLIINVVDADSVKPGVGSHVLSFIILT